MKEWPASRPDRFNPEVKASGTCFYENWNIH